MKKLILIISLAFFALPSFSQGSLIKDYFAKYAGDENFTKVSVNAKMFSLFTELDAQSDEEKEFLEAVSKLKGLKILACDSIANAGQIYKKVCDEMESSGYEELMTVVDGENDIKFSILEEEGEISELLMAVGGDTNFVLLSLFGEIDLKNISKITRNMHLNGLENLSKIDDESHAH